MANRIRTSICGTTYTLVSDEPAEYMQQIASEIDAEMTDLVNNDETGYISTITAAVLVALDKADELHKEQAASDHLREQLKEYADDAAKLQLQLDTAKRELQSLRDKAARRP